MAHTWSSSPGSQVENLLHMFCTNAARVDFSNDFKRECLSLINKDLFKMETVTVNSTSLQLAAI